MASYRVQRKVLQVGAKQEMKEHPWASPARARRIAGDHIKKYGPGYYAAEPVVEKIILSKTKQIGAKPIRRKKTPRPFNPLTDSPFF